MFKKLISIALICSVLIACVPPQDALPLTTPNTRGQIIITFAAPPAERARFEPLIRAFNQQQTDMQVQFVALDAALPQGADRMRAIASAADTALLTTTTVPPSTAGVFADLTVFQQSDPTFRRTAIPEQVWQAVTDNAATTLLPAAAALPLLAYHPQRLAEQGVTPPTSDWTWRDVLAMAEQLAQQNDDSIAVYGVLDAPDHAFATTALLGLLAEQHALPTDNAALPSAASTAALARMTQLIASGAITPPQAAPGEVVPPAAGSLVAQGVVALWPANTLAVQTEQLPFTPAFVPFPALPNPADLVLRGYVISSGTSQPHAAWRWLAFLHAQRVAPPPLGTAGLLPVYDLSTISAVPGSWEWAMAQALLQTPPAPVNNWSQLVTTYQAALTGESLTADTNPTPRPPAGEPVGDEPITVATPVPPISTATTRIRFAGPFLNNWGIPRIAERFQRENPEIAIELLDNKAQKSVGGVAGLAGSADCFSWLGPPYSAADYNETLDLQPLMDADPTYRVADHVPAAFALFQRDGRQHGMPFGFQVPIMFYNKTAFDQLAITPPHAGWTLDQWVQAATQLTRGSGHERFFGYAQPDANYVLTLFLDAQQATLVRQDADLSQPNFTDPAVVTALQRYLDLLQTTSPYPRLPDVMDGEQRMDLEQALFEGGRIGMWVGSHNIFSSTAGQITIAAAAPPLSPKTTLDISARGLYIAKQTPYAAECWRWIRYLSEDLSALRGIYLPARQSLIDAAAAHGNAMPGLREVYRAYEPLLLQTPSPSQSRPEPLHTYWLDQALDRVLQGDALPQALEQAQRLTSDFMRCTKQGGQPRDCALQTDPDYTGYLLNLP
jgi:ABC-type glycerol-3-phosphate transport system substrate-binding protein